MKKLHLGFCFLCNGGSIAILRKAVKRGEFEPEELQSLTQEDLEDMEKAIVELLGQIKTMGKALLSSRNETRRKIAEFYLFLKGVAAIPLMPFIHHPTNAIYLPPNVTLRSYDLQEQLMTMLTRINNQKIRLSDKSV